MAKLHRVCAQQGYPRDVRGRTRVMANIEQL